MTIAAIPFVVTALVGQQPVPQRPAATEYDYSKSRAFPHILSAYNFPYVPPASMSNSDLIHALIQDGKLDLSVEDAITLAIENNLDVAVARYNLPIAQTDLLRARAGGATRGVAGAYQSTTLFAGVLGGGVGGNGGGGVSGAGGILGGGIPSVGPVGCCDPSASFFYGWNYGVTPLNYQVVSGVAVEDTHSAVYYGSYGQGFLTGTSLSVGMLAFRESSNATNALFNPEISSGYVLGFNQHLLNGFGYRANAKFIRIARNDQKYSESVFRQSVTKTLSDVLTVYYGLLYDRESLRVAREGLGFAQKLLEDNEEEAKIGAMAQLDVVRAQLEVAARGQDVLAAENSYEQDQQTLKADISKSFNAELAQVRINPTGRLPEPQPGDVPPLAQALRIAAENRPEIEQADLNLRNQQVTIQAVRNALLPSLDAFAVFTPSGLAESVGPSFTGLFQNRYPDYAFGLSLSIPIRNRIGQADAARALLEQRQLTTKLQQAKNQVVWDVSKAVSAATQASGELDAARKVIGLAKQNLTGVQTKFELGRATVSEVIQAQRDLSTAEASEVKARSDYAKALIQFELATGTIMDRFHIQLADAKQGRVSRPANIPGDRSAAQ